MDMTRLARFAVTATAVVLATTRCSVSEYVADYDIEPVEPAVPPSSHVEFETHAASGRTTYDS